VVPDALAVAAVCEEWSPKVGTATTTPTVMAVADTAARASVTLGVVFTAESIADVAGPCHPRQLMV